MSVYVPAAGRVQHFEKNLLLHEEDILLTCGPVYVTNPKHPAPDDSSTANSLLTLTDDSGPQPIRQNFRLMPDGNNKSDQALRQKQLCLG